MHLATSDSGSDATLRLLPRSSDDLTPTSYSPDSLSDFYDEFEYKRPQHLLRQGRLKRFCTSLTQRPLYWRTRRKFNGRVARSLIFVLNLGIITFIVATIYSIAVGILRPSYWTLPAHYQELEARLKTSDTPGRGNPRNEKIFIASNIIQHEMIRGPWGDNLLKLVDYLGPENVFVSIYENDSGPETTLALSWLRDQLACDHNIVFGDHIPLTDFPTVVVPSTGEASVKRITYLSEVRNRMMAPLDPPPPLDHLSSNYAVNHTTVRFDKLLFLNDIYYRPEDALHLLFSTNYNHATNRSEYLANCALDFIRGGTIYDSFVVRDLDGYEITWFLYPWFTPFGTGQTRKDVMEQKDAVRVRSCWSGMAAYDAAPFLRNDVLAGIASDSPSKRHQETRTVKDIAKSFTAAISKTEEKTEETDLQLPLQPPLRFRHEGELFWEASECCLINADLLARHPSVGTGSSTGIFVNPYVRVAYEPLTFKWQRLIQRFERGFGIMQLTFAHLGIKQEVNPRRTEVTGLSSVRRVWSFDDPSIGIQEADHSNMTLPLSSEQRSGRWVNTIVEKVKPGGFCGQRRLFVMMPDLGKANRKTSHKNWKKIEVPWGY